MPAGLVDKFIKLKKCITLNLQFYGANAIPVKLTSKSSKAGRNHPGALLGMTKDRYFVALSQRKPGLTVLSQPRCQLLVSIRSYVTLERKSCAEFTPDREWYDGAGRVDEASGMAERRRAGNVVVVVVAVVGSIRQVERLRDELQIHPFP